jgi:hypothetical protein
VHEDEDAEDEHEGKQRVKQSTAPVCGSRTRFS